MRRRRWLDLLKYFDCEIKYYPGKSNAAADALSRKVCSLSLSTIGVLNLIEDCCFSGLVFETDCKPLRLYAIQVEPELILRIKEIQKVDQNIQNSIEMVRSGHQSEYQVRDDVLYVTNRLVVPDVSDLKQQILTEAHCSRFSIHPGGRKMYNDLRKQFWWKQMKSDIADFVSKCLNCQQVKAKKKKP